MIETLLENKEQELIGFSKINKSDEDVNLFQKILNWDLSRQNSYLVERGGCSQEKANEMEREYKRFLFLNIKYSSYKLPMSKMVDDIWHAHVLSTRNYYSFCEEIAGRFIHHGPTISDAENRALMPEYLGNTIPFYAKHFGKPSAEYWPTNTRNGACCVC